jgi:hypothetical protein
MEFFSEGCPPLNSVTRYFRIDRREIGFFRFILEAYDGLALLRTLDPRTGLVALHIGPGCEADVMDLVADLGKSIRIEAVKDDTITDDPFP